MDYFKPYKYIKSPSYAKTSKGKQKSRPEDGQPLAEKIQNPKPIRIYIAGILILLGLGTAITKVIKPYAKALTIATIQKPVFSPVLGYKTGQANFSFEELKKYARAVSPNKNVPEKFFLTIPKLKIYEAEVKTNDTSLAPNKMLGHYAGTALPGESFNSFIYGHAVFEEYFDPLDYKKIFSTLPNLLPGDEFYIKYLNKTYKYVVTMKKTLEPSDVNPYENFYPDIPNNSTVSLMTCVPPGRKDFRLIVVGSLVKQGN